MSVSYHYNLASLLGNAASIVFLTLLFVISSILVYGIYNVYFHPLRRFPGPKLWAAYRILYVVRYFQGVLPYKVLQLHRQYGPVVRIAPDELAFTNADAWHGIYGLQPDRRQNEMDKMTFSPEEPGMEESFAGATDTVHTRLRRIYAPAFAPRAIDDVSSKFLQYADLFVSRLTSTVATSPIQDLHEWYNFVSFDILGDFAFGESFHCLETAQSHFFMKIIVPGIVAACKVNQLERYGVYTALKPLIPKSVLQAKVDIDNYVDHLISRRLERKDDGSKKDVFTYLSSSELSRDALHQNAIIIVMAGSHTITTILTSSTFFLCKHPDALKRVQAEVRSAFQTSESITAKAVQNLPYLSAVIQETLRLIPGGAFGNPRWIRGKGGQAVAGHHIPENTRCSIYHYAAYRYEGNFTRPDEFIPERWLPHPSSEFAHDDHRAFEPFNVGPRACIGKAFGNLQSRILLAKTLWHFDFALADPEEPWTDKLGAFPIWDKPPLRVKVVPVRI